LRRAFLDFFVAGIVPTNAPVSPFKDGEAVDSMVRSGASRSRCQLAMPRDTEKNYLGSSPGKYLQQCGIYDAEPQEPHFD
jgi:hypothetical protein